jgi:hypothetical protein
MYQAHFPKSIDPNWMISDDDPDNKYIELLKSIKAGATL